MAGLDRAVNVSTLYVCLLVLACCNLECCFVPRLLCCFLIIIFRERQFQEGSVRVETLGGVLDCILRTPPPPACSHHSFQPRTPHVCKRSPHATTNHVILHLSLCFFYHFPSPFVLLCSQTQHRKNHPGACSLLAAATLRASVAWATGRLRRGTRPYLRRRGRPSWRRRWPS